MKSSSAAGAFGGIDASLRFLDSSQKFFAFCCIAQVLELRGCFFELAAGSFHVDVPSIFGVLSQNTNVISQNLHETAVDGKDFTSSTARVCQHARA